MAWTRRRRRCPDGWRERLVRVENENTRGNIGWCLEPHDLAVSKLAAGREKDIPFVAALIRHGLVRVETVSARLVATAFPTGHTKIHPILKMCPRFSFLTRVPGRKRLNRK